jgi:intracellular septation protein
MFIKFLKYSIKLALSIFPILTFYLLFKKYDVFFASKIFVVLLNLSFLLKIIIYKKIRITNLINFLIINTLSILTVIFHNRNFIKFKSIIFCFIFSILLIFSQIFMKKTFMQIFLETKITLPVKYWKKINIIWSFFFIFSSVINFFVQYNFTNYYWNNYKFFIFPTNFIIFFSLTTIYVYFLKKKIKKKKFTFEGKNSIDKKKIKY